ncbi:hypothetical protein AMS68_000336 [Peltaster fructicola]|uniref:Uncharacterized protein n=1 Tax=Peltaster fructicola TaxID=286661 RepID=A0A6H0XJK6_9PEZI|nr:hypothetical protein AMS68_000336 [Peltaster fructicola]
MTRRIVYGISSWVFLASACCTIAAVILPNWISYTSPSDHDPVHVSYGLFQRCSSLTGKCTPYPQDEDCQDGGSFCSMWRSTGFFMNLALVLELACVVAYITVLYGGRGAREVGWKIVVPLLSLIAAGQLIAMALVAYLFDHDERFFIGMELDKSWALCTVSWTVLLLNAAGVLSAAYVLPYEDDYEPIA